ncbi:hypothetical protein EBR66_08795 [bacterium]|nr:hypothetical protein [bacterium]
MADTLDPYKSTRFPRGTLPRKYNLLTNTATDSADGRKKIGQIVRGDSMRPELNPGDIVKTYVDSKITDVKVGDYVTFINDGGGTESYYTHKVIEVYENPFGGTELVTRGVNNNGNDRVRVTECNFIGIARKYGGISAGD